MKRTLTMIMLLLAAVSMHLNAAPKKIYATLDKPKHTFTLYNDEMSHVRSVYESWTVETGTRRGLSKDLTAVYSVVLDESMKDAEPESTTCWFANMICLKTIKNLEYLNTSKVTNMDSMFYNCRQIVSLDLSTFNVNLVGGMKSMMEDCSSLAIVDLSTWYVYPGHKGFNTERMFANCTNLRVIFSDNNDMFAHWSYEHCSDMFLNCKKLTGGNGTKYDS